MDEPAPSEIRQLMDHVEVNTAARRNTRGGRSAQEHLVAVLRCLYRRAADNGLIKKADNPARKWPSRAPCLHLAGGAGCPAGGDQRGCRSPGDDPEPDTPLLLRLHTEIACRRGGARPAWTRTSA